MAEISYKNYLIWGYNEVPFSLRKSNNDKYFIDSGRLTREPLPYRDECIATAQLIYEQANGEIPFVLFSGGMDSQVIVEAFRLAKVPFNVVIIKLRDFNKFDQNISWNWHDIKFAIDWCEAYNIKPIILDIDVIKFWENDAWDIGSSIRTWSPQFCVTLWAIDQIEGFPVTGNGETVLERHKKFPTKCWDIDHEAWRYTDKHAFIRNRNSAPSFFKYTPELKASHLLDLEIIKFANNEYTGTDLWCHKNEIYTTHFPNLKPRPNIISQWRNGKEYSDYNGFEFMPKYAIEAEQKLRTKLQENFGYNEELFIDYDQRVKDLTKGYEHLYEAFKIKRKGETIWKNLKTKLVQIFKKN